MGNKLVGRLPVRNFTLRFLAENLLNKLKTDLITILINLTIIEKTNERIEPKKIPNIAGKKIRRNEPCFCGSEKKYKHCCGNLAL